MPRRIPTLALLSAAGVLLLAGLGCTEKVPMLTAPPVPSGPIVAPDSIQAIFTASCITCHSGSSPAGGMDLSADGSYASTVGVPSTRCAPLVRVAPNDPSNSCLMLRVEGTVTPRMPMGRPALAAADIAKLRNWILQGAPGVIAGPAF